MRTKITLVLNITNKMLKHFLNYSLEKDKKELYFTDITSNEFRYLNNFEELGFISKEVILLDGELFVTYYLTKVGEIIRKQYA